RIICPREGRRSVLCHVRSATASRWQTHPLRRFSRRTPPGRSRTLAEPCTRRLASAQSEPGVRRHEACHCTRLPRAARHRFVAVAAIVSRSCSVAALCLDPCDSSLGLLAESEGRQRTANLYPERLERVPRPGVRKDIKRREP